MNGHVLSAGKATPAPRLAAWRRLLRQAGGVSTIEFALFAPFLFFAVVAMVDLGLALHDRMTLERLLRGGAQSAMSDPGADRVRDGIQASAAADFAPGTEFQLTVNRYCTCPVVSQILPSCNTLCSDNTATSIVYRIEASRSYPGLIMRDLTLDSAAEVQIR